MIIARQSTARTVTVGPVLDADGAAVTDGVVGDFKISKNGGAPAALNASATLTHRHTGHYSLALTATDLNTVGSAEVTIDDTTNTCGIKDITVIEEAVYDAFYAASAVGYVANQPVDLNTIKTQTVTCAGGVTIPAATLASTTNITAGTIATVTNLTNLPTIPNNWITAAGINADAITAAKIADGAIDAATFAADVDAEILSYLVDDATRIDASALNTLSGHDPGETIMGATDLGTGSGLTSLATAAELAKVPKSDSNVTWNATALASIQSEANDALVAYDPPTNAEMEARTIAAASYATAANLATVATDVSAILVDTGTTLQGELDGIQSLIGTPVSSVSEDISSVQSSANIISSRLGMPSDFGSGTSTIAANLQDLADNGTAAYDRSTDSLQALRDRGDSAWTTATGFSTHSAADVWAAGTRTLTAGTNIALAKGTGVTGFTDLSAGDVRTAVGLASANLDTQLGDLPTAAEIFAATLTTQLTEAYAADGTAPTLAQAIFLIQQSLHEFSISGTTRTVKKLDGTTTAATFTLDDATSPTSTTRAT